MDHAEARAQLMELAVEPARLRGLDGNPLPAAAELRAHLATCPECRSELAAWQSTVAAIDKAVETAPAAGEAAAGSLRELASSGDSVVLPPGLRARTLASVQELGNSPVRKLDTARRPVRLPFWLAMAAAVVVVIGSGFIAVDRTQQVDRGKAEASAAGAVANGLAVILQDPAHRVAQLTTLDGKPAGSVSWSISNDTVVVLAQALASPPSGQLYRCRVGQGGTGVAVGEMQFSGSLAYWAGSLGYWSSAFTPGSVFTVNLEPIGGGGGTQVLSATL